MLKIVIRDNSITIKCYEDNPLNLFNLITNKYPDLKMYANGLYAEFFTDEVAKYTYLYKLLYFLMCHYECEVV